MTKRTKKMKTNRRRRTRTTASRYIGWATQVAHPHMSQWKTTPRITTLATDVAGWKTNPISICEKLVLYIGQNPKVSLDALEARAVKHGIAMSVFDQAVAHLHKLKGVKRTASSYGVVKYELQVEKKKDILVPWVNIPGNYPRPGENGVPEFVMPFPSWDLSHIFLTPTEMLEYRAKLKGKVFIRRKKHEFNRV